MHSYRILVIIEKLNKLVIWSITAQSTLTSQTHRFIYLCLLASLWVICSCDDVKLGNPVPLDQAVESSALTVPALPHVHMLAY